MKNKQLTINIDVNYFFGWRYDALLLEHWPD